MTEAILIETYPQYYRVCTGFNPEICQQAIVDYDRLKEQEDTRKTHFFEGRYENIYINRQSSDAFNSILSFAEQAAQRIVNSGPLRAGFWVNDMSPGHRTLAHTHDDDDELLSGVFYLKVPKGSGNLTLGQADDATIIQPEAGTMLFFSPKLIHEVGINQSQESRLSIGMNFGLACAPLFQKAVF